MTEHDDPADNALKQARAIMRRPFARNGPTFITAEGHAILTYTDLELSRTRLPVLKIAIATLWTDDTTCEAMWEASP